MNNILENLTVNQEMLNEYKELIRNKTIMSGTKSALSRKRKGMDVYTEIHHYIPKSLGGTDDPENLVLLTGEDHFLAHWLLYKATMHKNMIFAFNQMSRYIKNHNTSSSLSQLYQEAREDIANTIKQMAIARCDALTEEDREKMSKRMKTAMKGKRIVRNKDTMACERILSKDFNQELHENMNVGTTRSEETKEKMSKSSRPDKKGYPYHKDGEIRYFLEGTAPDGWIRGNGIPNKHTKGTVFFHNPETKEQIRCAPGTEPAGWVSGRARFNNHFAGKIIKFHIVTGDSLKGTGNQAMYVSHGCKGLYTYIDLHGVHIVTGALQTILADLNLDREFFLLSMKSITKVISKRVSSNNLNKTHLGKHISDVYNIQFHPRE